MKCAKLLYCCVVVVALILATGLWKPITKASADNSNQAATAVPSFRVDASWPKPLPAPIGVDGVAHTWVQGEVAGVCVDADDNVFTVNRAWETGVTIAGVIQGNESGAINGNDASASAIPAPVILEFNSAGKVVNGFGNAALTQSGVSYGGSVICPTDPTAATWDYQGNVWTGGNGDGIVPKIRTRWWRRSCYAADRHQRHVRRAVE